VSLAPVVLLGAIAAGLNLTLLVAPTHWITFARPVMAEGPYGLRRRVRSVGIQPDDADRLDRVLDARPA
jgi:hypothetical protein